MAVVGIDLGTTNTVVGFVRNGQATTVADEQGRVLVPSAVSFHPNGTTLVGHAARERRPADPRNTVYSIKRLIGRSWNSEEVARARERFPFDMKEGPGQAALVIARGETFTLPEISAFVLRHVKAMAEKALGEDVDRAVITVPANFNDLQRAATKVAGRVAGLEVMRILNEPTAAALAYGYGRDSDERVAIYDFGGGTFDVTLLDMSGNVFEVLATAGNTFLGGDDVDLAIAQRMAEACVRQHRYDPRTDRESFERLRLAAEAAKIALSTRDEYRVRVPGIGHGSGKDLEVDFTMTARELDVLASPIVDQTFAVCEEVLSIARLGAANLDQVVLVGGSTRLRVVATRVAEFFGRKPLDRINPDEVVAIGAAMQANALTGAGGRRSTIPNPPMPAARTTESQVGLHPSLRQKTKSHPPAHPSARGTTDPDARQESLSGLGDDGERRRLTTGMGLGPDRAPAGARTGPKPPLPPRRPPQTAQPAEAPPLAPPQAKNVLASTLDPRTIRGLAPAAGVAAFAQEQRAAEEAAPPSLIAGVALPPAPGPAQGAFAPALPEAHRIPVEAPRAPAPPLPLLIDVTPLTLCVETVGGYCDAIIQRNTPVPCSQSRTFVTAADDQTTVLVRVAQGESTRFEENTALGDLELSDLRPAARGATQIVVTFSLDTDGMLEVVATDAATGKNARARVNLVGLPSSEEVDAMAARSAARRS